MASELSDQRLLFLWRGTSTDALRELVADGVGRRDAEQVTRERVLRLREERARLRAAEKASHG